MASTYRGAAHLQGYPECRGAGDAVNSKRVRRGIAMNVVLVLSDSLTGRERTEIVGAIEHYGEWIALSHSSYAIRTSLSAETLAKNLKRRAGVEQGLFVVSVSHSYDGHAPLKVKEWLTE